MSLTDTPKILLSIATISIVATVAVISVIVSQVQEKVDTTFAPTAPLSQPSAAESNSCTLTFTVLAPTATPLPTATNTPTPSPSNTPTPLPTFTPTPSPTPTPLPTFTPTPSPTPSPLPTFTPTPSPTPTPSNTPSPSPTTPPPLCLSIAMSKVNPDGQPYKIGDQVQFTCGNVIGATNYEFRVAQQSDSITTIAPISISASLSQPYTIPASGSFAAQCRYCMNLSCSPWEALPDGYGLLSE